MERRSVLAAERRGHRQRRLLVPFGLLIPVLLQRLRWWTVPMGSAVSGAIELTQLLLVTHRSAQWSDWVWNTTGVAIGFGVWLISRGVVARRTASGGYLMR